MYSVVNSFWDEVTDVSVRVTMKGDNSYFDEDDIYSDLLDTFDMLGDEEDFDL